MMQQITNGTLRATEAWTDGGHAADDMYAELDCELAVAPANVTEGRSSGAKSSNDPAPAQKPTLATPTMCKDAKEFKETLTAWQFKVAEYDHQFIVMDEAQKTFVVREAIPKDIQREFLTGLGKFDKILEKLEIIINDLTADDGPVPMDLGNVGTHDARTTQSDQVASNDMSYDDVCAVAWKGTKRSRNVVSRKRS